VSATEDLNDLLTMRRVWTSDLEKLFHLDRCRDDWFQGQSAHRCSRWGRGHCVVGEVMALDALVIRAAVWVSGKEV